MKNLLKSIVLSMLFLTCFTVNVFADNKTVTEEVTISQNDEGTILISCEDDAWSALVAESGAIELCADCISQQDMRIIHTIEAKDIVYSESVISISKNYVTENIYPSVYRVIIKVDGYHDVEPNNSDLLNVSVGKTKTTTPTYTIVENEKGEIVISSNDTNFINDIWRFTISNDDALTVLYYDEFVISGNTLTIDVSSARFINGNYDYKLENIAYENSFVSNELVLSHQKTKQCPEFSYEFNASGDLVISSTDADWINGLTTENKWLDDAIEGTAEINNVYYSFGSHNSDSEQTKAFEIVDGKAVFSVNNQLNTFRGQIINGIEYDVVFSSSGYTRSDAKKITFTHARKHIPDTKVELSGNYLFIKSSDSNFIDNIKVIYIYDSSTNYLLTDIGYYNSNIVDVDDNNFICYEITNNNVKSSLAEGNKIAFWTYNNDYVYADGLGGSPDWKTLEVINYDLTFKKGEHGVDDTMSPVQVGGTYRLPNNGFEAEEGYEFLGWKFGDSEDISFVNEKVFVYEDTDVTALWKEIPTPTITVDDTDIEANNVVSVDSSQANVMNAKLDDDNLSSLLSPTDVASGAAVWMETSSIDIDDNNYKQLNRALSLESKGQLLKCLEINVFKQVKGQSAEKVSETYAKAKISLDLSDNEELMEKAINGELYVYNIHNGKISDLITGTYNPTTHIFTFEADEFSTYGLVFVENTTPVPTPTPKPKKKIKYVAPSTGVE